MNFGWSCFLSVTFIYISYNKTETARAAVIWVVRNKFAATTKTAEVEQTNVIHGHCGQFTGVATKQRTHPSYDKCEQRLAVSNKLCCVVISPSHVPSSLVDLKCCKEASKDTLTVVGLMHKIMCSRIFMLARWPICES